MAIATGELGEDSNGESYRWEWQDADLYEMYSEEAERDGVDIQDHSEMELEAAHEQAELDEFAYMWESGAFPRTHFEEHYPEQFFDFDEEGVDNGYEEDQRHEHG